MSIPHTTAGALERARITAGLTLAEVGTHLARDPRTVRRWETGHHTPPKPVLLRLGRLYDCNPAQLID